MEQIGVLDITMHDKTINTNILTIIDDLIIAI